MAVTSQPSHGRVERRIWRPAYLDGVARRHRVAQTIECFVPDPIEEWDPTLTASTAALIAEADAEVREFDRQAPGVQGLDALARQLLRQESVSSSRIENLIVGQRRLARAAAGSGAKHDATADLVIGNVRAMQRAIELAVEPRPLTREDIIAIHRTLLEGTVDEPIAGVVREEQNWIGRSSLSPAGADFIPPPPEYVEELLDDLAAFLNLDDLPVTLQAAIAHAQFEAIHPFLDGNGRVGRCLIHVVYRRRGLASSVVPPISLVLATHHRLYVGGLTAYCFDELKDWLLFFAACAVKAVDRAHDLAFRVEALREQWLRRVGQPRSHASSRALLHQLTAEPVLTVARAAELVGVSETAAARALDALERAGVLTRPSEQRWGRRWEAPEVFELLEAFERDVATPGHTTRAARPAPKRGSGRQSS
ncbi:MAG TPA: Fic family protein [Conexibacter sp.]|nr:Fic family protein [Conexibacter sp.]